MSWLKKYPEGGKIKQPSPPSIVRDTNAQDLSLLNNKVPIVKKTNKPGEIIKKRDDFEPWWNWAANQAAGYPRSEHYGQLGDLYRYYAGQPLKDTALRISNYKPTLSKNPNAKYIAIEDSKFKQEVIDNYDRVFNKKQLKPGETQINDNTFAVSGYTRPTKQSSTSNSGQLYAQKGDEYLSNAIGRYFLSKGKDEKGEYISYYDVFNANQPGETETGDNLGLTKGFEIYDRIYIDPKTNKPKMPGGGIVPLVSTSSQKPIKDTNAQDLLLLQNKIPISKEQLDLNNQELQRKRNVIKPPPQNQSYIKQGKKQTEEQITKRNYLNEQYALNTGQKYDPITGRVMPTYSENFTNTSNKAGEFINNTINAGFIGEGALQLGNFIGENLLPNAYKYNPLAWKPNPESYYRTLGKAGYEDALSTNTLRPNPLGDGTASIEGINMSRPSDVSYFAKGKVSPHYPGSDYIAEVDKTLYARNDINPVTGNKIKSGHGAYRNIDETGKATNVPLENANLYKRDWLQGYKQLPKPTSTQSITRGPVDWGDAVNKDINPNFSPRAYENSVKSPYVPPETNPELKPYIKNDLDAVRENNSIDRHKNIRKVDEGNGYNVVNHRSDNLAMYHFIADKNYIDKTINKAQFLSTLKPLNKKNLALKVLSDPFIKQRDGGKISNNWLKNY